MITDEMKTRPVIGKCQFDTFDINTDDDKLTKLIGVFTVWGITRGTLYTDIDHTVIVISIRNDCKERYIFRNCRILNGSIIVSLIDENVSKIIGIIPCEFDKFWDNYQKYMHECDEIVRKIKMHERVNILRPFTAIAYDIIEPVEKPTNIMELIEGAHIGPFPNDSSQALSCSLM